MFRSFLLLVGALILVPDGATAEGTFLERFALSTNREEVLKELIPGTREYYYYHCMHYQNTKQFDRVDEMLKKWIDRYKTGDLLDEIRYRQAVLTYDRSPDKSLQFIRDRQNLRFNHQRDTPDSRPKLSTSLDEKLIARNRLFASAMRRRDLGGFEPSALRWLVRENLPAEKLRHLLGRLTLPDVPRLPELVIADLRAPKSGGFGSIGIHRQLLLDQLKRCGELMPELFNDADFVNAWAVRLRPNSDVDMRYNRKARDAYISQLQQFTSALPPNQNSLKAHVLYQRLKFDAEQGRYSKDTFLKYLRLPRRVGYMDRDYMKKDVNRRYPCDLNADFQPVTSMPKVGNDDTLVREYLMTLLARANDASEFEPYLNDTWLQHVFAETKIVNGVGDAEKWYALLPPTQYKALRDRIDIDFSRANQQYFDPDDPVALDVFVKNVPTLIVKVFEINAANFYRDHGREVNTDINLDGLVASREQTIEYKEPALRRVRRRFEFPEMNRRGIYVVDFIGNGKASRALVRKGKLQFLTETTVNGQRFTVFNEQNEHLKDASVMIGEQVYEADDSGHIMVPFSTSAGTKSVVLRNGSFVSLAKFQHEAETYSLAANMFVDRETLIRGDIATLIVRSSLSVAGQPASLSAVKDVRLLIESTDQDGISSTTTVDGFHLLEDRESTHEFKVPKRVASLKFTVTGKVKNISQGKDVVLQANHSVAINGIDKTTHIVDAHFGRIGGKYVIDVLGRTGEARNEMAVALKIKHRDFTQPVQVSLKSNQRGRIMLGKLQGVSSVEAKLQNGITRTLHPHTDYVSVPTTIGALAGRAVRVPTTLTKLTHENLSVLEERAGSHLTVDLFESAKLANGFLELNLPPGNFRVTMGTWNPQTVRVQVAEGTKVGNTVLGKTRSVSNELLDELQIRSAEIKDGKLNVQLTQSNKFARLHVFVNTFRPEWSHADLGWQRGGISTLQFSRAKSQYVEGRNIGDEYRYILDRRNTDRFPGNMNSRPGILLNPWPVRTTQTGTQEAAKGEAFAPAAEAADELRRLQRKRKASQQHAGGAGSSNLDFLGDGAIVLANLEPDENGRLSIDLDDLGGHQEVHIVAVDPIHTITRSISLPEAEPTAIDLRLAGGFDPQLDYSQQKQITALKTGEKFELGDVTTSQLVMYDSLRAVYQLLETLNGDANFKKFRFVLDWPELEADRKRALYSEYACHELNFFLMQKDPKFFASVVKPYLANKYDKTFLDEWLLGMNVSRFTEPWAYAGLNTLERILLAQRLQNERKYGQRFIADQFAMLKLDTNKDQRLFATALGLAELAAEGQRGEKAGAMMFGVPAKGNADGGGFGGRSLYANDGIAGKKMDRNVRSIVPRFKAMDKSRGLSERGRRGGTAKGQRGFQAGEQLLEEMEAESLYLGRLAEAKQPQLFRQVDKTQEWAENNYYRLTIDKQIAELITIDAFWNDYAAHKNGPFVSSHIAETAGNFSEMMLALAVLDLPFEPGEHDKKQDGDTLTLTAGSPSILVHEQIRPAKDAENKPPVLVGQNFFRLDDRYRMEDNHRVDKFVTDEFLIHTVYGAQVVVTNPTSTPRILNALLQIPIGAMPVRNTRYTSSETLQLGPYATKTIEYLFYFPGAGDFDHYPVHVALDGELVADSEAFKFHVVTEPTRIDQKSWEYVSQYASAGDVIKYLQDNNLNRIDVGRIAWRMKERPFFERVLDVLDKRHHYNETLWSYAAMHNDKARLTQYLRNEPRFVAECGIAMESSLLDIEPVDRMVYQHLEYRPLVNARAHQLGAERKILNDRFREQYARLMSVLSQRAGLSDRDLLAVSYYMLLQDRIGEALGYFDRINAEKLDSRLQYDYFAAYVDFYSEGLGTAKAIVAKYNQHPVDEWREAFENMAQKIKEVESGNKPDDPKSADPKNRNQLIADLANADCSLDVAVDATEVQVDFDNLDSIRVNYYLMDIELLFSRNPFVQGHSGHFSHVMPNAARTIQLPKEQKRITFELPENLHHRNVLVEVVGRGRKQTAAYYSNSLALQTMDSYGQLRVTSKKESAALPGAYVKCYAKMKNGQVKFYKDGYTDLRGRFDYASLSTNQLDNVERFSLLIMSDKHGAIVKEVTPPTR